MCVCVSVYANDANEEMKRSLSGLNWPLIIDANDNECDANTPHARFGCVRRAFVRKSASIANAFSSLRRRRTRDARGGMNICVHIVVVIVVDGNNNNMNLHMKLGTECPKQLVDHN